MPVLSVLHPYKGFNKHIYTSGRASFNLQIC